MGLFDVLMRRTHRERKYDVVGHWREPQNLKAGFTVGSVSADNELEARARTFDAVKTPGAKRVVTDVRVKPQVHEDFRGITRYMWRGDLKRQKGGS